MKLWKSFEEIVKRVVVDKVICDICKHEIKEVQRDYKVKVSFWDKRDSYVQSFRNEGYTLDFDICDECVESLRKDTSRIRYL